MSVSTLAQAQPTVQRHSARLWEIDALRGLAVICMVFFHFMWDLWYFGWYQTSILITPWQTFARGIGSTFLLLLGLSATLTYTRLKQRADRPSDPIMWFVKRGAFIFGCGLVITIATYFSTPGNYVVFGILHLLGLSLILLVPFLWINRWITLLVGIVAIVAGGYVEDLSSSDPWLIWLGIKQIGRRMSDFYPVLPWFGVALVGVFVGRTLYPSGQRRFGLPDLSSLGLIRALRFLGRHSLLIYLVHQPLMFGIMSVIHGLA